MKKFLLFECDERKNAFELLSVFNGKCIESLHKEIISEIKRDIRSRSIYMFCNISILFGVPEEHKTFIEYEVLGFIYPPYSKTIIKNFLIHEITGEQYYKHLFNSSNRYY